MNALLLSLALAAGSGAPAPRAEAPAAPAAELRLPRASPELGALALPALLLAAAAGALLLARRRRGAGRLVQVLETTPLGGRRCLVVARLGDELLLLGASEAGVALLRSQPAAAVPEPAPRGEARPEDAPASPPPRELPAALAGLVARLRPSPRPAPPAFADLLAECAEDQELRRKLARGERGTAR